MLIGVDIDEVLAATLPSFLAFFNKRRGTHFAVKDFHSYCWEDILGLPIAELAAEIRLFLAHGGAARIPPFPGSLAAVQELRRQHRLVVITSRWGEAVRQSSPWLEKNFPSLIDGVYFSLNEFVPEESGGTLSKAEICSQLGVELMIEDSVSVALDCQSSGIPVLLLAHPWNRIALDWGLQRVASWAEIPPLVAAAES